MTNDKETEALESVEGSPAHNTSGQLGTAAKMPPRFAEFRPSKYMRGRRPQLFSDSSFQSEAQISREAFEYHLETLTHRKQETQFEYFCRRLAEKEICPNLLPQTGPTGGGDSKVDSETYPVADALAEVWYEGIGREAASERWAFAFSAKKKWKPKADVDVAKIAATKRDYKLIYFVTNQFVPDKKRVEFEEALTRKHGIPVRILDRSWIMRAVFEHDRIELAVESLGLTPTKLARKISGPHDVEREAELRELDAEVADPTRYQGVRYQLAEDCLRSALLARGLERPQYEVDARFERAKRIAESAGDKRQILHVIYQQAWTALWWREDYKELNRLYDDVERLAEGMAQAHALELLLNLWQLVVGSVGQGKLSAEEAKIDARTSKLKEWLDTLAADINRPNNALQCRMSGLLVDLSEGFRRGDAEGLKETLRAFRALLVEAKPLGAFPVERFADLMREIGSAFADNSTYDELFDDIVATLEERRSAGEGGRALVERGYQKLQADRKYEAIRLFGRAQEKLIKHEYRHQLVGALLGCGSCYEQAGLLWAARMNILAAATVALSEFHEEGAVDRSALLCLQRLAWGELQLGRVPQVLTWIEMADLVAAHLGLKDKQREAYVEQRTDQDLVLGLLHLKTHLSGLKQQRSLPNVLKTMRLPYSHVAALYVLGYENELRTDGWFSKKDDADALRSFFRKWVAQPAAADLPDQAELLEGPSVTLRSLVLGCEVAAVVPTTLSSLMLAESLLGALEALLATSLDASVMPHRESLTIRILPSADVESAPKLVVHDVSGGTEIEIVHRDKPFLDTLDERRAFSDWLSTTIGTIIAQMVIIKDPEEYFARIGGEERGIGRALQFAETSVNIGNVLGHKPKFRLSDWQEAGSADYPLRRERSWSDEQRPETKEKPKRPVPTPGTGEPPPQLLDPEGVKHAERRVLSLIDIPAWNRAGWGGVAYFTIANSCVPPLLGLMFSNPEAANSIFSGWLKRVGHVDAEEVIYVAIVTGIDKDEPFSYKAVIRSNIESRHDNSGKQIVVVARMNRMRPADSKNLDRFLKQFRIAGRYGLVPVCFKDGAAEPTPMVDLTIEKAVLHVKRAWEIGENDPDVICLDLECDPIIPTGVTDAPVSRALAKMRRMEQRRT